LSSPSSWLSEMETLSNLGWLCPLCKAEKRWYMGGQIWRVGKIRWAMLTGYIFPEKKRNWILRVWIDFSMYKKMYTLTPAHEIWNI
jgi:hypothetical protein